MKFVNQYSASERNNKTDSWFRKVLLYFGASLPTLSSLIIARPPIFNSEILPDLLIEIANNLPHLNRFIVREVVITIQQISRVMSTLEKSRECTINPDSNIDVDHQVNSAQTPIHETRCHDFSMKRRLDKELRDKLEKTPTKAFQMIFIDVCDTIYRDGVPPNLEENHTDFSSCFHDLIRQAYSSKLGRFCYEGHQKWQLHDKTAKEDYRPNIERIPENVFEILISPTRDLRVHMELTQLNDKVNQLTL